MSDWTPADTPTWQAVMLDGLMEAYVAARTNGDPFDFTASSFNLESKLASCHEQWLKLREPPVPRCRDCRFALSTRYGGQCVHPEALSAVWDTAAVYASSCTALRHADDKCGPEGKLFEAAK